jgi:hypothetical protein
MAAHADGVISVPVAPPASAASRYMTEGEVERAWWGHLLFGFGAGVIGFLCAFVFATTLELSRPLFVLCYAVVATPFLVAYFRWSGTHPLRLIRKHWLWGVAGAIVVGAFLVRNVLTQDPSPRPQGVSLVRCARRSHALGGPGPCHLASPKDARLDEDLGGKGWSAGPGPRRQSRRDSHVPPGLQ